MAQLAHKMDFTKIRSAPADFTSLEDTECSWICERWAMALQVKSEQYWSNLAGHMHIAAMAIWELNAIQRREYLTLSALAETHATILREEKEGQP